MKRLIYVLLFTVIGCKEKYKTEGEKNPEVAPSTSAANSGGSEAKQFEAIIGLVKAAIDKPGHYDPRVESKDFDPNKKHTGVLSLNGVVEVEASGWSSSGVPLLTFFNRMDELGRDDKVESISLNVLSAAGSFAQLEEMHRYLLDYQKVKPVHCFTEQADTMTYYILSACSSVTLAPSGMLVLSGVGVDVMHLKPLMDRFDVKADFVSVGSFKGAAEPLTRPEPSPQMRRTYDDILDQAFSSIVSAITSGRKLDEGRVRQLIDKALISDREAVNAKLVDKIASYSDFLGTKQWQKLQWTKEKKDEDMMAMLGLGSGAPTSEPHVSLVYAVGNIVDGRGSGSLERRSEIASGVLIPALQAIGRDKDSKAVVLRVDSGGGSALASELMLHEIRKLTAKKPVIVSMGGAAASGGYYISAPATKIFANNNTLTGSIGVVGGKLAFGDALRKQGVNTFHYGRGLRSSLWSAAKSWNQDDKAAIYDMMNEVYELFKKRVGESRKLSPEQVGEVAQGRVWTGKAALKHKLVDEIGGLREAIAEAKTLAKLPVDAPVAPYPSDVTLVEILRAFKNGEVNVSASPMMSAMLALPKAQSRTALSVWHYARSFTSSPIQTVYLPVVFGLGSGQ